MKVLIAGLLIIASYPASATDYLFTVRHPGVVDTYACDSISANGGPEIGFADASCVWVTHYPGDWDHIHSSGFEDTPLGSWGYRIRMPDYVLNGGGCALELIGDYDLVLNCP